jgi:hypothetical protein
MYVKHVNYSGKYIGDPRPSFTSSHAISGRRFIAQQKKLPMCNRSVNEEHTKKYRSVLSCRCFGFFSAGRSQKDWFISFECSGLGWLARFTGPSKYFRHLAPFSETPHMVFSLPLRIFLTTSANGDLVYGVMGDF